MTNEEKIFFINKLKEEYQAEEVSKIEKGLQSTRPTTLRINTMVTTKAKVLQELKSHHLAYEEVPWYQDAIILKQATKKDIENLSIYQQGEIYLQSLSSMLPPLFLNPKPKESILDMTAAPGGKTTQMYALSHGQAMITACEKNKIRGERLKKNLEIQKATRVSVLIQDATKLDSSFSFDKILLDAPCSGSGTILWNQESKESLCLLLERLPQEQKRLLRKAIEMLKKGEEMIYSTCSILKEENEEVLATILKEGKVELVPCDGFDSMGIETLTSTLEHVLTICPTEEMEGFFIAKLRRK